MKTKMKLLAAFKIWIAIYPLITLFLYLFGERLAALPLFLRTLVLTLTLVPTVVFVAVPFIDRLIPRLAIPKNTAAKNNMQS